MDDGPAPPIRLQLVCCSHGVRHCTITASHNMIVFASPLDLMGGDLCTEKVEEVSLWCISSKCAREGESGGHTHKHTDVSCQISSCFWPSCCCRFLSDHAVMLVKVKANLPRIIFILCYCTHSAWDSQVHLVRRQLRGENIVAKEWYISYYHNILHIWVLSRMVH